MTSRKDAWARHAIAGVDASDYADADTDADAGAPVVCHNTAVFSNTEIMMDMMDETEETILDYDEDSGDRYRDND